MSDLPAAAASAAASAAAAAAQASGPGDGALTPRGGRRIPCAAAGRPLASLGFLEVATAAVLTPLLTLLAGLLVAAVRLPFLPESTSFRWVLLVAPVLLVCLHPKVLNRVLAWRPGVTRRSLITAAAGFGRRFGMPAS